MLALIIPERTYANELLENFEYSKENGPNGTEVYLCNYKNHRFLLVVTGYGKVNIGSSLRYVTEKYKVKVLLGFGSAGSIVDNVEILSAVIAKNALQFDVDFMPLGYMPAQIPKVKKAIYQANEDLVECAKTVCQKNCVNYCEGLVATSDMFVCNNRLSNSIRIEYDAAAVDCECGNIGQFAFMNKIPFVGIKVVSNYANNNAVRQYNLYDDEASIIAQKIVCNFLKEYYG